MNTMKCEMCSGNDIVKQDGMYVCQHCGTKYSVEEAKKLLVEENVEIDNSNKQTDLHSLARSAKAEDDSKKDAQYYRKILLENPDDWEATFYSLYYEVMDCQPAEIYSECRRFKESLPHILELVPEKDKNKVMVDIYKDIDKFATKMFNAAKDHYLKYMRIEDAQIDYHENIGIIMIMLFEYGDMLEKRNLIQDALIAWERGLECYSHSSYQSSNDLFVADSTYQHDIFGDSTYRWAKGMVSDISKKVKKYRQPKITYSKSIYRPFYMKYWFGGLMTLLFGPLGLLLLGYQLYANNKNKN